MMTRADMETLYDMITTAPAKAMNISNHAYRWAVRQISSFSTSRT